MSLVRNRNETRAAKVGQGENRIYPEQEEKPQEALEQRVSYFTALGKSHGHT